MASLKGATSLWNAATIASGAKSALAEIGPGPWAALYIDNQSAVSMTFKIQVAAVVSVQAGRNALDGTADGGLVWYDYIPQGATATPAITIASGADPLCFELSPFGPPFIRLVRTDANAAGEVTAFVTCYGPN